MSRQEWRDCGVALALIGLYVGPILFFVAVAAWEAWG